MNHERLPILELHITHPLRPEYLSYGQGVALLIYNQYNEILLGREAQNDREYGRVKGQWNIVTETQEPGERVKDTVIRALREELKKEYVEFSIIPGSYRETNKAYVDYLGYLYKYRCICLRWRGSALYKFHGPPNEITQHQWVSYDALNEYDIEYGAKLVIEYYQNQLRLLDSHLNF